jgi:hypothetical protein
MVMGVSSRPRTARDFEFCLQQPQFILATALGKFQSLEENSSLPEQFTRGPCLRTRHKRCDPRILDIGGSHGRFALVRSPLHGGISRRAGRLHIAGGRDRFELAREPLADVDPAPVIDFREHGIDGGALPLDQLDQIGPASRMRLGQAVEPPPDRIDLAQVARRLLGLGHDSKAQGHEIVFYDIEAAPMKVPLRVINVRRKMLRNMFQDRIDESPQTRARRIDRRR